MLFTIILTISMFLLIVLFKTIRRGLRTNILVIYLVWWMGWISYSTFNPFGLFEVSLYTYALLIISVTVFSIIYITKVYSQREGKRVERGGTSHRIR